MTGWIGDFIGEPSELQTVLMAITGEWPTPPHIKRVRTRKNDARMLKTKLRENMDIDYSWIETRFAVFLGATEPWKTAEDVQEALKMLEMAEKFENIHAIETLKYPPMKRETFLQWKDKWPLTFKPPSVPPVTAKEVDSDELPDIEERMMIAVRESLKARVLNQVS